MSSRIGIMQPYFLPYLGYFSLIAATDRWIFFDTAQYMRHGWVNRNRILKPGRSEWQYIMAPLEKHSRETCIKNIVYKNSNWQDKILAQIEHYKKVAPFYKQIREFLEELLFGNITTQHLSSFNIAATISVCKLCDIPITPSTFSEMEFELGDDLLPDEWALEIVKCLGYETYINPPGGEDFFSREKYQENNINLKFLKNNLSPYNQKKSAFIPGLSIIDALMFCGPEDTRKLVYDYEIYEQS